MLTNAQKRANTNFDDGYFRMTLQLDALFENRSLDFTAALALFYLSYEIEHIRWDKMPRLTFIRGADTAELLGEISRELLESCSTTTQSPVFQSYISNLTEGIELDQRRGVALALTRASSILRVCEKYADRLSYESLSNIFLKKDFFVTAQTREALATASIVMLCAFLEFNGIPLAIQRATEVIFEYCVKGPHVIYKVVLDDMDGDRSGFEWFEKNMERYVKTICKEYRICACDLENEDDEED